MKTKTRILLDCGTSYSKIHFLETGRRRIAPARDVRSSADRYDIVAATGHNTPPQSGLVINELVALAEGGLRLIDEQNFTLLDCGARDVKFVTVKKRKVVNMDWNAECGAFTGQLIELLTRHFQIDPAEIPAAPDRLNVVCGVLGMTGMFDRIAAGAPYPVAFAEFLRGVAFNCERLVGKPKKLYLSGGLCSNKAFLNSFSCEVVPLGRFVLLDGLAAALDSKHK